MFLFVLILEQRQGSTHDSWIFENSYLNTRLEMSGTPGHLLGDSGYGLKPYLLTPYPNPDRYSERKYNKVHSQTRMSIEKAFGVLKRRFPLLKHGLRLRKAEDNCKLILSAFVMHNMIIHYNRDGADAMLSYPVVEQEQDVAYPFDGLNKIQEESEEGLAKGVEYRNI